MSARGPRKIVLAAALAAGLAGSAWGEATTDSPRGGTGALNASARLDFILNIGRFIFFRVGARPYPATSAAPASVSIAMQPSIPSAPTLPGVDGNNLPVPWSGALPTFAALPAAVPVQVYTNAGQVSIRANVVAPLVSGANSIPLSQITVTSTDPGLPAPPIPDAGAGVSVNVSGTAFGNLVATRSADWNFSYNPAVLPPPGTYTGQISFTAVSP